MATAEVVAAFRAADRMRPPPERIFDDPYAELFVTDPRLRRLLDHPRLVRLILRWRELLTPGIVGGALLRYRYDPRREQDRKSTRLNSSHVRISYAVFCLKKKIRGEIERRAV